MRLAHRLTVPQGGGVIVPKLVLSGDAYDTMLAYALAAAPNEVNGFAFVQAENGAFVVTAGTDVFITKQTVTEHAANVDGGTYALAVHRAAEEGRADKLRLQWHVHPDAVYHSATDMASIETFGSAGAQWLISVVLNRRGETCARYDAFRPVRFGAAMEIVIYRQASPEIANRVRSDIASLVTVIPATPTKHRRWRRR